MEENNETVESGSTKRNLLEAGKSLGTLLVLLVAAMDARVRPVVGQAAELGRSFAARGARLARQVADRHIVSGLLRPLLTGSIVILTFSYVFGWYAIRKIGVEDMQEAGWWVAVVAIVSTVAPLVIRLLVHRTRGMRDVHLERLHDEVASGLLGQAADAVGQMRAQVLASLQALVPATANAATDTHRGELSTIGATLRFLSDGFAEIERLLRAGEFEEAEESATRLRDRIAEALNAVDARLPNLQQDQEAELEAQEHRNDLDGWRIGLDATATALRASRPGIDRAIDERILNDFGRPGYAPLIAVTLVLMWLVASAWYLACGIVLKTWYVSGIIAAGIDPRWTSAFIGIGGLLFAGAVTMWLFHITLVRTAMVYGLGFIRWAARSVVRPLVEYLDPTTTPQTIRRVVPDDLGVPLETWNVRLATLHAFPVGVAAGVLMLLFTRHSIGEAGLILADGFIWLAVYVFVVNTKGFMQRRWFDIVVLGHVFLGLALFALWVFDPAIAATTDAASGAIDDESISGFRCGVTDIPAEGIVGVLILGGLLLWLAKRSGTRSSLAVAAIGLALLLPAAGVGAARMAFPGYFENTERVCFPSRFDENGNRIGETRTTAASGASPPERVTSLRPNAVAGERVATADTCTRRPGAPNQCP